MIARIIEYSLKNRLLVLVLTMILVASSIWAITKTKLDAIPDLSDVQVIITTEFPGQNPEVVDDQITYPLSSALLSVPGAKVVRGYSMFEQSFVYVLFEDGTDLYWARSRVLEYLNFARDRLPKGVEPKLGPDATGVGWVYQYVLYPGFYSPDHPKGIWHDKTFDRWYVSPDKAPEERRSSLVLVRGWEHAGKDPLTGTPLVDAQQDISQLRSLQDWYIRFPLTSVEDVSEVASIGGFVKQYQIVVDPLKLKAFDISLNDIMMAVRRSNNDVGGATIELSENEYMVRSRGYLRGVEEIEQIVVGAPGPDASNMANNASTRGTPILLRDVASIQIAGEMRRGIGELDGRGEAVGGVVIARFGANAFQVIKDAKAKLAELEEGLPAGVFIKTTYDRSELIGRSVSTLRKTLIEEIVVVGLVCILFLLHARSELVAVFVVPASVLTALLVMHLAGINANIMSLGGIAIAIGVVVDSAIVMVENAHKHLDREEERIAVGYPHQPRYSIILAATVEVGPQLFFSLLIITVSFLPVFVLDGEAGRLFKPLAYTKTFAMASAAILSITIIPVLMYYFITGRVLPKRWGMKRNTLITIASMILPAIVIFVVASKMPGLSQYGLWIALGWAILAGMLLIPQKIIHESHSPISNLLQRIYSPAFSLVMKFPAVTLIVAILSLVSVWYPWSRMGTEFMPPLDEGDLLYMPTTDPSLSITTARQILQQTDKLIKTFPEVMSVHGKIGRAESATDPAPTSMIESVIQLNPDHSVWRKRSVERFWSGLPQWASWPMRNTFWPDSRTITTSELKLGWTDPDGTHHAGLNDVVSLPGIANAWPFPIENRINMLATGIKTPIGIKIFGSNLEKMTDIAQQTAVLMNRVPGTISSYSERTTGGYYLDIDVRREDAARYGLTTGDVQDYIQSAVGGMNITTTVEGLQRYPLNLRFARDYRDDLPSLRELLINTSSGSQIPLGQIANILINPGPPMIRSEDGQRTTWIYVDIAGRDIGGYIADARQMIAENITLPPGYRISFSGTFEMWERTVPKLIAAGLLTLALITILLYLSCRSWFRVSVVMLAVPFSLIGALWFTWAMDYNLSLATVIGIIALAGLDAETGMVMLLYLDNSADRFEREGKMRNRADLWHAVHDGAVMRIRPKAMTVAAAFIGLVPLLWADGTGADTMRRIAAPMIGGLIISFLMELLVYPVLFYLYQKYKRRYDFEKIL